MSIQVRSTETYDGRDVLVLKLPVKSAFCNWLVMSIFLQEVEIAASPAKCKLLLFSESSLFDFPH